MSSLIGIFADVLLPVGAIVGLGFVIGGRWLLDMRTLSALAFRILGPAFVFRLFSESADLDLSFGAMAVASVGSMLVVWFVMRVVFRSGLEDRMAATFGNVGNLGFPIVLFALGESALPAAGVHFLAVTVVALFMGISSAARHRSGGLREAAVRILTTPMVIAGPLAAVVAVSGYEVPLAVSRSVSLLADAMIPVMLLVLGMQLAESKGQFSFARLSLVTVMKLVLVPLVYMAIARAVGLTGVERDSGLLLAAMPTAVIVGLVSVEFDLETESVTGAILVTSLVSIVSVGVLIRFL